MNYVYGTLFILIGLFFTISAFLKSELTIYRILRARSKIIWKDHVYTFHKVIGIIFVIMGFLFIFDVF